MQVIDMELCHINNRNRQQIKSGEYLLPFHPESFFLFPAKKQRGVEKTV